MARLKKGMYGDEEYPKSNLFRLRTGQSYVERKILHNAVWFNKDGERLGWGDIAKKDIDQIAAFLEEGEMFVFLHESDANWDFYRHKGPDGERYEIIPKKDSLGTEYIGKYATYFVIRHRPYYIERFPNDKNYIEREGVIFTKISRKKFRSILGLE